MARRLLGILIVALLVAGVIGAVTVHKAAARPYLALGDSVTFGYRDADTLPSPDYYQASSLVGFPALVGADRHFKVTNLSCPGETTASFVDADTNNVCWSPVEGYRTHYPLHVAYSGPQQAAAVAFLHKHRNTRLVTLMLGINDLTGAQGACPRNCPAAVATALQGVTAHLHQSLLTLRATGYRGALVVLDYYDAIANPRATDRLNLAINAAVAGTGATVADPDFAFTAAAGPSPCQSGLLLFLHQRNICGKHPTARGQRLLATTVEAAIGPLRG